MKALTAEELYEQDFVAWSRSQARELRRFARTPPNLALDLRHIGEEIADAGRERRDSVRSWTARIIEHLLLLEHSPAQEPRTGWIDEIVNSRSEIERRLSCTLERDLKRRLPQLYAEARRNLQRKLERYGEPEVAARPPRPAPTGWIRSWATSGRAMRQTAHELGQRVWPAPQRSVRGALLKGFPGSAMVCDVT